MTYADATAALSDLATTSRYRVPNSDVLASEPTALDTTTVALYHVVATERMSALIGLALASMRADAERERAKWEMFSHLLTSAS